MTGQRISKRIAAVSPSATLAVDAKAKALQAQGESVIGFGAGEPDFPTPEHIVAAAEVACRDPKTHKYTPTGGLPELREALAVKTRRDSGLEVTASQILVTNGGKQAIANSFAVLCDPGDEVLVLAPYWTTYPEVIALAGGVPVVIATDAASGFRVTLDQLEEAYSPRTKVLLFVSPSNPTGAVYPRAEIEAIGQWAVERGLWVLTDEIYEHLVYGGAEHHSMPVLVPELADHCIVVNGVAKTFAMTGWRVGWMIGPNDVVTAATNLQSHETSNVANVSQRAALAAVTGDLDAVAMMRACPRAPSTPSRRWRASTAAPSGAGRWSPVRSWPIWPSRRPRWPWCPARPSGPRATSGCPTPWATTTWSRGSRAWPSCSARPHEAGGPRSSLRHVLPPKGIPWVGCSSPRSWHNPVSI